MINKQCLRKEYIISCSKRFPNINIDIIEVTIYALNLLECLLQSGVPLIFKGGTSLLLLLPKWERISTDIDIIVSPDFNFDKCFEVVKKKFPFFNGEERGKKKNKYFRHFKFEFESTVSNKIRRINLDVTFAKNIYKTTTSAELRHTIIKTIGKKTYVNMPTIDIILGDKLTAFAPTTIGVNPEKTSLGTPNDNRLQVMKQFFDIARLSDSMQSIDVINDTYKRCHKYENNVRNTKYTIKETLLDTFNHAANIASNGKYPASYNDFYKKVARPGIQGLSNHLFKGKYNVNDAINDASKIMYLTARLLTSKNKDDITIKPIKKYAKYFNGVPSKKAFELINKALSLLEEEKIL